MNLVKRYIAKEFVGFFLVCALSLIVIGIVFSTLAEIPSLNKENGFDLFLSAILSGIPLLIEVIVPISVLLATVLAFISLSKTSEIIAMMSSGVTLFQMVIPVLLSGVVIALLLYLNQSYLAPYWGADKRVGLVKTSQSSNLWRFHQNVLYLFASPNRLEKTVERARSFEFGQNHQIEKLSTYCCIARGKDGWTIERERQILTGSNDFQQRTVENKRVPTDDFPVVFTKEPINPKYSSIPDLIRLISLKTKSAVSHQAELFAVLQKIAGLFSIFVMILLALPFSIYVGRSANVRSGIVISVVLGFVFWLVDQILISMHNTGSIPMLVSAFGANLIFLILALVLIRWKRT